MKRAFFLFLMIICPNVCLAYDYPAQTCHCDYNKSSFEGSNWIESCSLSVSGVMCDCVGNFLGIPKFGSYSISYFNCPHSCPSGGNLSFVGSRFICTGAPVPPVTPNTQCGIPEGTVLGTSTVYDSECVAGCKFTAASKVCGFGSNGESTGCEYSGPFTSSGQSCENCVQMEPGICAQFSPDSCTSSDGTSCNLCDYCQGESACLATCNGNKERDGKGEGENNDGEDGEDCQVLGLDGSDCQSNDTEDDTGNGPGSGTDDGTDPVNGPGVCVGDDCGNGTGSLGELPFDMPGKEIFEESFFSGVFDDLLGFNPPSCGAGSCPVIAFSIERFRQNYSVTYHCDLMASIMPVFSGIMGLIWALAALGIVLRA
jgi:hypothetical protein